MRRELPIAPVSTSASFVLGFALTWLIWHALARVQAQAPVSDEALAQSVRSRVNALVSRPEAIVIEVQGGVVRVSGPLPPNERDALLHSIIDLPGVVRVRSALATLRRVA
jgi:hypothetical protein